MGNHPNRGKVSDWPAYLQAFRTAHGFTQATLGDALMISKRTVEDWESGRGKPAPYLKLALEYIKSKLAK